MKKDSVSKYKSKETWSSYITIRQSRCSKEQEILSEREIHYIMVKGSIQQENIIINVYIPPKKSLKCKKEEKKELKRKTDISIITVADFNTPLLVTDKISRHIISKDIGDMINTINQLDLIDIYKTLLPQRAEYIFFSSVHGTFIETHYFLDQKKKNTVNCKVLKILQSIFLDHMELK